MDRLKQLREPATVVALVGLALQFALTLVYFLLAPVSFGGFLIDLGLALVNPVLLALLAVLVASCWIGEATPHARRLTVLALVLTAVLLATSVGMLLIGLVGAPAGAGAGLVGVIRGLLPWLTTAVITLGMFIALLRPPLAVVTPATDVVEPAQVEATPPADPQLQPGWSPDAAVGAVWRRAGDAAAGAPATNWDVSAQTTAWGPIQTPDRPPQPPAEQL